MEPGEQQLRAECEKLLKASSSHEQVSKFFNHCVAIEGGSLVVLLLLSVTGVYNAKAEECTTPRIGSKNIKI